MLGYEKVNKRRRQVPVAIPAHDSGAEEFALHDLDAHLARFVDLREVATEPPSESIARENEIVERLARASDFPERPCEHPISEQLLGLVDPEVIRRH
jgi:hypothetical protein